MLEWIAEKIAIIANFPWRLPIIGLLLTILGAIIPFFVSELPLRYVALFYSCMMGVWGYAEAKGNPIIGPVLCIIALLGNLGWAGVQNNMHNRDAVANRAACLESHDQPALNCKKPPAK